MWSAPGHCGTICTARRLRRMFLGILLSIYKRCDSARPRVGPTGCLPLARPSLDRPGAYSNGCSLAGESLQLGMACSSFFGVGLVFLWSDSANSQPHASINNT